MGITIHYKGKLNDYSLINTITGELSDIANEMDWKYNLINDKALQINGIVIKLHPDSEPLTFLFDKEGTLNSLLILHEEKFKEIDYSYVSTKTQFAPIEIHVIIVKLLKYLKQRYINNLVVTDEGEYWETQNKKLLKEKFDFLSEKITLVQNILSEVNYNDAESPESLADKIEKVLLSKLNNKTN